MDKDTKEKIDEMVSQSDFIVASPDAIKKMQEKGLPIKSVTTTYKEYLDKLFVEKRKTSESLITKLPHLDNTIANGTIQSLYDELRECFVLGIPGAAITLAIILLELALKYRLYDERLKDDPNSSWDHLEQLDLTKVINDLKLKGVITLEEQGKLNKFNSRTRHDYIHYKIQNLIRDLVAKELPSVDVETLKITVRKDVKAIDYPSLWFSAKRVLDKETIIPKVGFCINWVNKILAKPY